MRKTRRYDRANSPTTNQRWQSLAELDKSTTRRAVFDAPRGFLRISFGELGCNLDWIELNSP